MCSTSNTPEMDPTTWHTGSAHVTLTDKKHQLRALQETIRFCRTVESLTHSTTRLVSCFSSDPEVIQQCCQLLGQLMTKDGFPVALASEALGRLLRYLPLFIMADGNGNAKLRVVGGLNRLILRFTKMINADDPSVGDFPFCTLLNFDQLIFNCRSLNESRQLVDLTILTIKLGSTLPTRSDHMVSKDMKKLISTSFNWLRNRTKSYNDVLDLSRFADCLLEIYFGAIPITKQYWVELHLELIYGTIFDRLLPDNRPIIVEFFLTILYGFLIRELDLDLKITVLKVLLQRCEGLRRTLTMFYRLTCNDELQLFRHKVIVTEILTHLVWRYEQGTSNEQFQELKAQIQTIVQQVDWLEVTARSYQICQLPVSKLTEANLWFIMLVQYFEAESVEVRLDSEETAHYVTNLVTLVGVCFLKQFQMPQFLVKFVLESVAKCYNHILYKNNELAYNNQLRKLVPSTNLNAIFGLLPTSIPRLRWFHQQALFPWKAEFLRRQRFEALQERLLPDNLLGPQILNHFPEQYLVTTLLSRDVDIMVLANAGCILSRVQLTDSHLAKIITLKLTQKNRGLRWPHFLRAVYGSLAGLNDETRPELVGFISMKLSTTSSESEPEALVLLVDSLVRIFATKPNLNVADDWEVRRDVSDQMET